MDLDWAMRVWYQELLGMSICPSTMLPLREDLLGQGLAPRPVQSTLPFMAIERWQLTAFDLPPEMLDAIIAARPPSIK